MDIIPTLEHFERADMAFAMGYYHWFWLAQPHDRPERMILRDVEDWFDLHTSREPKDRGFFHPEARADYLAALREPGTVVAICEDYRAAATHRPGARPRQPRRRREGPLPAAGAVGREGLGRTKWYDALAIWRGYASGEVTGGAVNSGHYLPEEAPEEVLAWLDRFL